MTLKGLIINQYYRRNMHCDFANIRLLKCPDGISHYLLAMFTLKLVTQLISSKYIVS